MDLLIGTKEDLPQSGAKPRELTFKEGTMSAASDKVESGLPKIAEDQPFSPDTVFTREQIASLKYARKMRELYKDTKLVRRTTLPSSCKFDGNMEKFETYKNLVEGHYRQQSAA